MARIFKVKKETVVKLFEYLGFKTAANWDVKRLQAKIKNLPDLTDGVKVRNPKVRNFLKAILAADKVVIKTGDEEQREEKNLENVQRAASEKPSKKVKKTKKTKKVEKPAMKKEVKKTVKKKVVKKEKTGKLGIMSLIIKMLSEGYVSKKDIVIRLQKEFPDKKEQTIKNTVSWQISNLRKLGMDIKKKDGKHRIARKK